MHTSILSIWYVDPIANSVLVSLSRLQWACNVFETMNMCVHYFSFYMLDIYIYYTGEQTFEILKSLEKVNA